jgi:hypothetical protein
VALILTWRRLFVGMDLQDESYFVLVPWRWALGDRPFVDEQNLLQLPGLLTYPFVKAFAVLRDYDVTGLVLYTRHLYLLLMIGAAVAVFLLLRRLMQWPLALLASGVVVTSISWATPQLGHNTLAFALLTAGAALGARVVVAEGGRVAALLSGVCMGLAVVAYPTLLFVMPFWAVLYAFAFGRRATSMIAEAAFTHPPDPGGAPTGPEAWRALSAWALGGAVVLVSVGLLLLSFGPGNLSRALDSSMQGAQELNQLGGTAKALDVAQGLYRFFAWRPYLLVAALLIYLVYLRWPRAGRALLAATPVALWLAAQQPQVWGGGYVMAYVALVPYLYLFLPRERRLAGAQLLLCVWAPSLLAGAMTAYTSAAGYVSAAVGLAPAVIAGGTFLCWALAAVGTGGRVEGCAPDGRSARTPWLALAVLLAVLALTVVLQFQSQRRDVPYRELTSRFETGPWWGISVSEERRRFMDTFAADLQEQARPHDKLLVFFHGSGFYLYWTGDIAVDTYWIWPGPDNRLPRSTVSYYRRRRVVPTLAVHLLSTAGMTDQELMEASAGLGYPPTLVRPGYAFQRKPAGESTREVLARLPGD